MDEIYFYVFMFLRYFTPVWKQSYLAQFKDEIDILLEMNSLDFELKFKYNIFKLCSYLKTLHWKKTEKLKLFYKQPDVCQLL